MEQRSSSPGLQLEERLDFHRRNSLVQRIAWCLLALLLIAALLGVFGAGGVFAEARVIGEGGVELRYDRFARRSASSTLLLRLGEAGAGSQVRVRLARAFIERAQIDSVTPEPQRVETDTDGVTYVFAAGRAPSAPVRFDLKLERSGRYRDQVVLEPGGTLELRQFIYP
jgi:hypothetical protein